MAGVLIITGAISTRSAIARNHMQKVHLDQWQNAQKDTMVCKDLIFYLVKKTSCHMPIFWQMTRRSKRQLMRWSLRRSPRYPHRQSMKITQVGDCLMLQYVFNCMSAPFQHQMSRNPWRQVASKCTFAGAKLLESQKGSIVSRIA